MIATTCSLANLSTTTDAICIQLQYIVAKDSSFIEKANEVAQLVCHLPRKDQKIITQKFMSLVTKP